MTTETAAATTQAPPSREASIQEAIESLFASKEAPKEPAAPVEAKTEPAEEKKPESEAAPAEEKPEDDKPGEEQPAPAKVEAAPKASDYALQIARAKRKLAAAKAQQPQEQSKPPSTEAMKRAAAIEAAGSDPLKAFEAAGLDLAAVVQAYENRRATEPNFADPLAVEVKTLAEKLSLYEKREKEAEDAAATSAFLADAEKLARSSPDYEYVAAYGEEGLDLVKELVLQAAEEKRPMTLVEAMKEAEAHYAASAEKAAKTKKLASRFTTPTRKPGIAQQSPTAAAAPTTQTQPKTVSDVINAEIDALIG